MINMFIYVTCAITKTVLNVLQWTTTTISFQRMRLSLAMSSQHYHKVNEDEYSAFSLKLCYTNCTLYYTFIQVKWTLDFFFVKGWGHITVLPFPSASVTKVETLSSDWITTRLVNNAGRMSVTKGGEGFLLRTAGAFHHHDTRNNWDTAVCLLSIRINKEHKRVRM